LAGSALLEAKLKLRGGTPRDSTFQSPYTAAHSAFATPSMQSALCATPSGMSTPTLTSAASALIPHRVDRQLAEASRPLFFVRPRTSDDQPRRRKRRCVSSGASLSHPTKSDSIDAMRGDAAAAVGDGAASGKGDPEEPNLQWQRISEQRRRDAMRENFDLLKRMLPQGYMASDDGRELARPVLLARFLRWVDDTLIEMESLKGEVAHLRLAQSSAGAVAELWQQQQQQYSSAGGVAPIKGVDVTSMSADIQENGVKLRLTVVDTPGFGDSINNEDAWQPILENIESRFDAYLAQENRVNRSKISDNRIDAVIYFIKPTGHCLRAIDIEFMKRLHTKVNLIPIVAKADTLTARELELFKAKIMADINYHGIQIFKPVSDEFDDPETVSDNREILSKIPFAVIGSEKLVERPDGTMVRGRRYPWGIIEVENEEHNDFIKLRQMLLRSHMEELKDSTDMVLYENYRTQKLLSMGHVQDNNVFREFNPLVQLEEERRAHDAKMQKMEAEMTAVFQQKVQEKESKLKLSEEELYARHKEMKTVLEKQRAELDDKKKRAEAS
ncbi:Cell division control protein 3, partial [Coemansia sp. RSA 25]